MGSELTAEEVLGQLQGEVITGGDATEDGIRIYTQSGLILFMFGLGITRADERTFH